MVVAEGQDCNTNKVRLLILPPTSDSACSTSTVFSPSLINPPPLFYVLLSPQPVLLSSFDKIISMLGPFNIILDLVVLGKDAGLSSQR